MPAVLKTISPVFSSADVPALLAHYRSLGFTTTQHGDPNSTEPCEYGFAGRDDIELHIGRNPDHDPKTTAGCCYVHVSDADALYKEWAATPGRNPEPVDTDYGLREGAHVDPDGNLIRFGSPLKAKQA